MRVSPPPPSVVLTVPLCGATTATTAAPTAATGSSSGRGCTASAHQSRMSHSIRSTSRQSRWGWRHTAGEYQFLAYMLQCLRYGHTRVQGLCTGIPCYYYCCVVCRAVVLLNDSCGDVVRVFDHNLPPCVSRGSPCIPMNAHQGPSNKDSQTMTRKPRVSPCIFVCCAAYGRLQPRSGHTQPATVSETAGILAAL